MKPRDSCLSCSPQDNRQWLSLSLKRTTSRWQRPLQKKTPLGYGKSPLLFWAQIQISKTNHFLFADWEWIWRGGSQWGSSGRGGCCSERWRPIQASSDFVGEETAQSTYARLKEARPEETVCEGKWDSSVPPEPHSGAAAHHGCWAGKQYVKIIYCHCYDWSRLIL